MSQKVGILSNQEIGGVIAETLDGHDVTVSLFPEGIVFRDTEEQTEFCNRYHSERVSVMLDLESFLLSLERPRRIFLVSKEQGFAEAVLDRLVPHLESGDILVDLCDVKFSEVFRRSQQIQKNGVYYLSTGLLDSDKTICHGISLLPGGMFAAYESMRDVFMALSAKVDGDFFCCPYIGPDGSGQYVKMVHSGIACGLLQIYTEALSLARTVLQCETDELAEIISEWNSGESGAYFLDVLCELTRKYDDETGAPMMDIVLDAVNCDRSVVWLIENALELAVPVPTIYSAVEMCSFSKMKNERVASSKLLKRIPLKPVPPLSRKAFLTGIDHAMYTACLCTFVQGFALLKRASDFYAWDLNLLSVAKSFQGSSYIRSEILYRVIEAFERRADSPNLLTDPYFKSIADKYAIDLRDVVNRAVSIGFPLPCLSSSVNYMDSYRASMLPVGMIQLVWDYAEGAGFERNDKSGLYHTNWKSPERRLSCYKKTD